MRLSLNWEFSSSGTSEEFHQNLCAHFYLWKVDIIRIAKFSHEGQMWKCLRKNGVQSLIILYVI